ncbi:MAG: NifB/NifX family molybdenum-iron cluster-binding protein [Victivallales bacterium]|nr:NifB/NifX family molybdenum-iron cluster-binding protein [Victivallales bacterium]MCF7889335.1 NifB/NifX family molybdenum-iron cluster-binding protein [Victivallales bacterium]
MKIVITSQGKSLDSAVDLRFGRAKHFIVYDTETDEFSVKDNTQNLNAAQGAGIQSAQNIIETGAEVVITGHCGPKAFRVLSEGKVKTAIGASGTVQEAIKDFENGNLKYTDSADVEGHWM